MALAGKPVPLEIDWKKGFVAFMCVSLVNLSITKKLQALIDNITEKFEENFNKGLPLSATPENLDQLKIIFRIQNYLIKNSTLIGNITDRLNEYIMPYKELIDKEVYAYYISSKTLLVEQLKEQNRMANEITNSINSSFKNIDTDIIKNETLINSTTEKDINDIWDRVTTSLNLEVRV